MADFDAVENLKDKLEKAYEEGKAVGIALQKAVNDTERDLDGWLAKWANSEYSLGIAISFGLVLIAVSAWAGWILRGIL